MIWLVLALETALAPLVALGVVLAFLFSGRRGLLAELPSELPERLGFVSTQARRKLQGRRTVWFHAASAGEVAGLAPLLKRLRARSDAPAVIVTTATASGRAAARKLEEVDWAQLAPIDAWPCIELFLRGSGAARLIITETELWPSTLFLAARAGLRPILINARLTERSLPRYQAAAAFLLPSFRALQGVYAQSREDAARFVVLGLDPNRVTVAGNTKYDAPPVASDAAEVTQALSKLGWTDLPLLVAGSTHPLEEELIVAAFAPHRDRARLVVAPRHVERADAAFAGLKSSEALTIRWTQRSRVEGGDARILLLDAMGLLTGFWPLARCACVGGTWVAVGGHNVVEPARAGVPVLFGPYTSHVEHPAALLEAGGGAFRAKTAAELSELFGRFLSDADDGKRAGRAARAAADSLTGASDRLLSAIAH
jgi:3-deoxy-D-manno-octulosonic-acid transferase